MSLLSPPHRATPPSGRAPTERRSFFTRLVGGAPSLADLPPGTAVDARGRPIRNPTWQNDQFLGQLMTVGFNFAPRGWALCDGQLLSVNSNSALFSLLGTTFGGDGRNTFALPDLRGRDAVHVGTGPGLSPYTWGERGGAEQSQLTVGTMASHNHPETAATAAANQAIPFGRAQAASTVGSLYADASAGRQDMAPTGNTGGNIPFTNLAPFLGIYVCIALVGIYPSRS